MSTKKLRERWKSGLGKDKLIEVIKCLETGKSLNTITDLGKYNGRLDLRGVPLTEIDKQNQNGASLSIKQVKFNSIDFSFGNISDVRMTKVSFENCLFEETKAKRLDIVATDFINCIFKKSDLSNSYLNQNFKSNSGSFTNVQFIRSNLSKCGFSFPLISDCEFIDCRISETNFDGSLFENCLFKGKIESAWFRGFPENVHKSVMEIIIGRTKDNRKNAMVNVDFSNCILDDVIFENELDLTSCLFPVDDIYIIVKRLDVVYSKLKRLIENEWAKEDEKIALFWIDNLYYNKKKHGMPLDLINRNCISNAFPKELYARFFSLLSSVNDEVNMQFNI